MSVGRGVRDLGVRANPATLARLAAAASDVMASARVEHHAAEPAAGLADDEFQVASIAFVESVDP